MKKLSRFGTKGLKFILILSVLLLPNLLMAQNPLLPPCDPSSSEYDPYYQDCPIDGGVWILAALSVAFVFYLSAKRKALKKVI